MKEAELQKFISNIYLARLLNILKNICCKIHECFEYIPIHIYIGKNKLNLKTSGQTND